MVLQFLPSVPSHPLPPAFISFLTVLSLLIVGFFVEDHYVSRLTVFSNSVALVVFLNQSRRLDVILAAYGIIGGVAGIGGLVYYIKREELPVEYYEITFFTYSSAPVGLFIALSFVFSTSWVWLVPAFFFGAAINSKLLLSIEEKTVPVNDLPIAVPVARWFLDLYDELA